MSNADENSRAMSRTFNISIPSNVSVVGYIFDLE